MATLSTRTIAFAVEALRLIRDLPTFDDKREEIDESIKELEAAHTWHFVAGGAPRTVCGIDHVRGRILIAATVEKTTCTACKVAIEEHLVLPGIILKDT